MVNPYFKKYEVDTSYNLKVLWSYVSRYKLVVFSLIGIVLALELTNFLDNFVFKFLVDKATEFSNGLVGAKEFIQFLVLIVMVFVLVKGGVGSILWWGRMRLLNHLEAGVLNELEKNAFWHILNLSYRYHLNKKTGSLISQFTRGVSKTEGLMDAFVFNFIPTIFEVAISLGVIVYFDKITAIIFGLTVTAYLINGIYFTHKQKLPQSEANYREDVLKQNLSDIFTNIETVKYFGKEKRTGGYFSNLAALLKKARLRFWNIFAGQTAIESLILTIGTALIFWFSFSGFIKGELTLGSIALIYSALWKIIPYLFSFMHGYRQFIRNSVDVSALFKTFKEKNEVADVPEAKELEVKEGEIHFEKVSFVYPTGEKMAKGKEGGVLKEFDLRIKKNSKIALVGPSGGGKTTVIKLLYRLFDLEEGQILIDGQDISQVTQRSLRNSMSIVPQEPILFDNTIYFNVAYANPRASKKQIDRAIKFAQLDKFIERLPYKEKTIVGERGVKLSGGEKQRVSIARAILADKKILILDEATSSLDSETEKEIQRCLEKLMEGRTTMMIAHRLSTIMKADVIVVLDEGRITEKGSHEELKKKNKGLYKKLWELQRGGNL